MTVSSNDKRLMFAMKRSGSTWRDIALELGKSVNTVKTYYKRHKALENLPPKPKLDRSKTSGLQIKNLVKENSKGFGRREFWKFATSKKVDYQQLPDQEQSHDAKTVN